ncbi:MAG: hypothetical protein DRI37_03000 [Chloroflexi bacterium]|nr:MAG: hypothetical protein DRI37_03000 [Chloroflexota bacterium]
MRRFMRNMAFHFARRDLAAFLTEHEDDLLLIFREEMQTLDDELPEERLFIDIKMVPLGEMVLKASLRAITRFLRQDLERSSNLETAVGEEDSGT